jgi:hypothetical protein
MRLEMLVVQIADKDGPRPVLGEQMSGGPTDSNGRIGSSDDNDLVLGSRSCQGASYPSNFGNVLKCARV